VRIKNFKDFYTGLLFMLFGGAFTWGAVNYSMGTAAKMGAGYFPFILGGLLTVLGVIVFIRSLVNASDDSRVGRIFIGLVVSIFAIILISSLASHESRFKETLISAVVLCLASLAMFVYGLNLQIPVWPAFIPR
jgi:hypothetical protein